MNMGVLEVLRRVGPGSGKGIAKSTLGKGPFVAATVAVQLFEEEEEEEGRLMPASFRKSGPLDGLPTLPALAREAR